ncbi:MAG: hypothetical protein GX638_10990, partial [Crenarchaeota archaeon]|nr:hypothetical protein [Thermoproteota archaeon]
MAIAQHVSCSNCGAPVNFNPGEIITTCTYCGFTTVIQTGRAFTFEHSLILNKFDQSSVDGQIKNWLRAGFMKPADLERKAKIKEKNLLYLPFWLVSTKSKTTYKGIFERIAPAILKDGIIEKEYDWLVLARKSSTFPTREYK